VTLLGVLSFFQLTLLPGILVLSASNYCGSMFRRLLLAFGLGLTANYLGVFALTLTGLYIRPVVLALFGSELLAIALLNRKAIGRWFVAPIIPAFVEPLLAQISRYRIEDLGLAYLVRGIATALLLCVALVEVGQVVIAFASNWGTIFNYVDTVLSWNRWALDWFKNSLPVWPYHYPQLLPANWSLTYVFMGVPLQYVAKGVMPMFMLTLLLGTIHLGWTTRRASFYVAAIVIPFLYDHCRISLTEGLADVAVACMAFLSFGCLVFAQRASLATERNRYLMIGAILAASAAVTKQAGLYFLVVFPLLARGLVFSGESRIGIGAAVRCVALYLGVILIVVVPFYVYAELQILAQLSASEVQHVTQASFRGAPVSERIVNAGQLLRTHLGDTAVFLCATLGLVGLADRMTRWIVLFVVVPFVGLWAVYFSYDLRNLSLALPFLAISVGTGVTTIGRAVIGALPPTVQTGYRQFARVKMGMVLGIGAVATVVTATLGLDLSPERLQAHHQRLQREVGNAALNRLIYAQNDKTPFAGRIVTNYAFLAYLPGLERLFVFNNLMSSDDLKQYLKYITNPEVSYFLVPTDAFPAITRDVEGRLQRQDFKELFRAEGFVCVEIVRR
jgi:hypothetical protein